MSPLSPVRDLGSVDQAGWDCHHGPKQDQAQPQQGDQEAEQELSEPHHRKPHQAFPKPFTDEFLKTADVVITMGCEDACPIYPGKRYEDWELEDPAGKTVDQVRKIRDELDGRVGQLLAELVAEAPEP